MKHTDHNYIHTGTRQVYDDIPIHCTITLIFDPPACLDSINKYKCRESFIYVDFPSTQKPLFTNEMEDDLFFSYENGSEGKNNVK